MTAGDPILAVDALHVAYGESSALFGVSLEVRAGEIVACVGRNGAGKTTLLRTIAGFLKPVSGSVVSEGRGLAGRAPYEIARMGIKYVPQDKRVFSDLTVRENLELGSHPSGDYDWERVFAYFPKLRQLLDRKAGYLSGGERQMLMIGRAILGSPKLLLVDEPTEGLAPSIVSQLKDVFRELSRRSALLLVEQNLPLVCAIADRIYALREGHVVSELRERGAIRPEALEPYL
ncbi:MAG TPA: ABC transporter ATP-binding protein [Burkholderiales bacterium]|nr:ABC transporter ATP-binding protein [Burkholderiales bacterium]